MKNNSHDQSHNHFWYSQSYDALIGYYCTTCGEVDWHNEHKPNLRSEWMKSNVTFPFSHKPVTFAELLETQS